MIDFSDWEHGLSVLKQALADGDRARVDGCMHVFAMDIERFAKQPDVNAEALWRATSIRDFYTIKMGGAGDYEAVVRSVINDLGNLAQFRLADDKRKRSDVARDSSSKAAEQRKVAAAAKHEKWQDYAAQVRKNNENLSTLDVAKRVHKEYEFTEYAGAVRTIRKNI